MVQIEDKDETKSVREKSELEMEIESISMNIKEVCENFNP